MNSQRIKQRWHAVMVLQKRMSQTRFWGVGMFLVMSISFAISSVLLINQLNFAETNIILIEKELMFFPILVNAVLIALFLAFSSMVQIAREYEQGTYELLLYGPMDEGSFLIGYFVAQIRIFLICLLATLVWALVCIWQLNIALQPEMYVLFLVTFFMTMQLISIGILFASLGRNVRNAVIFFSMLLVFVGGISLADSIVSQLVVINVSTANDPMLIVRDVLVAVNSVVDWISPFALTMNAMNAVMDQLWSVFFLNSGIMLLETALLLICGIWFIRRKGVRTA